MNILVLSWRDPKHPLSGGAEQVMHEHMKGWIRAGHNVKFFSSKMPNLSREELIDGVHVVRKGYQYIGVQIAAFFWYLFGKHEEFDLVIDEFHGLPFLTPLYVRKPIIAVIQETTREVWLLNPLIFPLNLIVGLIGYIFEFVVFIPYKRIPFMTGSNSAALEVSKMGIPKKNIKVVNHGVLLSTPKKIKKDKTPTVLYLGRLSKDKGIEDAIRAFSLLDKALKFQFIIIGKPETEEYGTHILNIASKLKFKNKIDFVNRKDGKWIFVSDKQKFQIMSKASVMINPSAREGWGLVNIEANSVGVPVIAYNSPGLIDSINDGVSGVICKNNNPKLLAEETMKIVTDPEHYKKLVAGSISWSKNFTWEKSRNESLILIESVASMKDRR